MQNHWRSADKRFKTVFEANPFGLCKRDVLDLKWTPIVTRAANIPLGGNIKCRRNHFRLCPQARSPFISRKVAHSTKSFSTTISHNRYSLCTLR
ncbi:hypothetical protein TNCV_2478461 [Trichonephila clavipes]|nr:hypothetical protein TNCV_2478461 [Trichonephila clavipes]